MKSVFLDDDGTVNPAHVIALSITAAVILWGCWESYYTHAMPSRMGEAGELLGGAAGINLAHRASDIVAKFKGVDSDKK
jgi:hypothetical protein